MASRTVAKDIITLRGSAAIDMQRMGKDRRSLFSLISLKRVVIVIMSKATNEVLERWNFSIETDSEIVEKSVSREKSDREIMREIQAIMRQITSSVFDVLAYADKDVAVPFTWIESDPKLIANPQMVKLHSFDTKIHNVDTLVSYKSDEWDEQ
ncbi:Mitotic spindle checkpoint protein MAD2 [Hibiscus syriacus]|uniref:Mitotic spindle checkpoint protein MAD2 n=1 Tax=Hibiscus syriacus TaxID=106335 RepID=A0A6A3B4M9_HIBSY|nr:Mitotic spindle checkpoint protein MAD2 [Hibiscus syriacus]